MRRVVADKNTLVVDRNRAFFLGAIVGPLVLEIPLLGAGSAGYDLTIEFNTDHGISDQVANFLHC
ncbi:hypothetical protein D3C80_2086290 [compost metagenome]